MLRGLRLLRMVPTGVPLRPELPGALRAMEGVPGVRQTKAQQGCQAGFLPTQGWALGRQRPVTSVNSSSSSSSIRSNSSSSSSSSISRRMSGSSNERRVSASAGASIGTDSHSHGSSGVGLVGGTEEKSANAYDSRTLRLISRAFASRDDLCATAQLSSTLDPPTGNDSDSPAVDLYSTYRDTSKRDEASSDSDSTASASSSSDGMHSISGGRDSENDHRDGSGSDGRSGQGKGKREKEVLTLPTYLTISRVVMVPAIVPAFYMSPSTALAIFALAGLTDWLDGFLARKLNASSEFGAFLDPVADKLMVATVLVLLCTEPLPVLALPPWFIAVPSAAIIIREIAMSAVREWAASQGPAFHNVVAVSGLGKWKTATQLISLGLLLTSRLNLSFIPLEPLVVGGMALLYTAASLGLLSLSQYLKGIWRFLRSKE